VLCTEFKSQHFFDRSTDHRDLPGSSRPEYARRPTAAGRRILLECDHPKAS
jgi:hypothetical protein